MKKESTTISRHHTDCTRPAAMSEGSRATTTKEQDTLFRNFEDLDGDLQSHVLSFTTESELWLLLKEPKSRLFQEAITKTLATKAGIHLSFLLQLFPNTIHASNDTDSDQQTAVVKLLGSFLGSKDNSTEEPSNLQYLECCNLRNVSGKDWLPYLPSSLQTLDLSGCAGLDPNVLATFLGQDSSKNLKQLNLHGCVRVSNPTVTLVADHHPQLEALSLGGCSQSISNGSIHHLVQRLQNLKHLDLQSLNNISDLSGQFMANLPESLESLNVNSCKQLRLAGLEALEGIQFQMNHLGRQNNIDHWANSPRSRHRNVMHLALDAVGTPRVGLCRGILAYFSMGRQLREVHLTGAEHIQDWEVEALAVTCAATLTCFQMRASRIGNGAIRALATHCQVLAEVDISACFRVGDEGIMSLCEPRSFAAAGDNHKRSRGRFRLRVLRLASLPGLTNQGIRSIRNIDSLHVLDVEDCIEVETTVLAATILLLPHLVDVNAKGIGGPSSSMPSLLRKRRRTAMQTAARSIPLGLRMVNQRFFIWGKEVSEGKEYHDIAPSSPMDCCTVRTKAQRLDAPIPLALMYHCLDCHLVPSVDRGMCACCVSKCHKGHKTFVGSWTRFYCDCPFGVADNDCYAIFPAPTVVPRVVTASK
jgi:hypothetical protein